VVEPLAGRISASESLLLDSKTTSTVSAQNASKSAFAHRIDTLRTVLNTLLKENGNWDVLSNAENEYFQQGNGGDCGVFTYSLQGGLS
jgi:hypothetical protein